MLAALLATMALAAPALAANHIKAQGYDLCIDNTDAKLVAGNPLQVWKCYSGSSNQAWTCA